MTVSAIDKCVFLGYTTNITTKHGDNMELTETNALFTYAERCKQAAQSFTKGLQFVDTLGQEYIAECTALFYQVEVVDMLAETNTQGK